MSRPLKIFMRGKRARMLQQLLQRMGYTIEDQPGLFGVDTRNAVKDFQKRHGHRASGEVDEALLLQMQQGTGAAPSTAEQPPMPSAGQTDSKTSERKRVDALIRLLIRKEVITEAELQAQLQTETEQPQPLRITQPPLT